jgi:DNA-directed RNA polymerase subunit beta'
VANLNPVEAFETLKRRSLEAISKQFPVVGKKNRLELVRIEAKDNLDIDDIQSQYQKKVADGTWAIPVTAVVRLVDIASGKVLDESSLTIAKLPKITRRYTYIVDGHERQHDSIFRMKPGIYHRVADNGAIKAQWNLQKGFGFDLNIDRDTGRLKFSIGKSNIPLYVVLKALNIPDTDMEKAWGIPVLKANQERARPQEILKLAKTLARDAEERKAAGKLTVEQAAEVARKFFQETSLLRPEGATHNTLGKVFDQVTGEALLLSGARLLNISRGKAEEDDRQSLASKDIYHTEDFVAEDIGSHQREVLRKIRNTLDGKTAIRDILHSDLYTGIIRRTFKEGDAKLPEQHNPLGFLSSHLRTSIRGEHGGVKSDRANLDPDKLINPTHLGFLDPIQSPEGVDTGIALHLPVGVRRKGHELYVRAWDAKTSAFVDATAGDLEHAVVAYPDQVTWKGGKPSPVADHVTVYDANRATTKRPWKDVRYILPSSTGLFSFSANLMPFLSTNSGNRAMTAAKQQEQAVSLVHREAPPVQVKSDGAATFEQLTGMIASHPSPEAGTVSSVDKNHVYLKTDAGKSVKVPLYNYFPLNGGRGMLHSESLVKAGDKVRKGQTLADTNFSKNGVLSLGVPIRTAYLPYKGLNYEDGVVISESAAKKLTSKHLHEQKVVLFPGMMLDRKRWENYTTPDRAAPARLTKLGDDGVIREGQRVDPGDVLIAVVSARIAQHKEDELGSFNRRILLKPYEDRHTVVWDHDFPGRVARVVKADKSVRVYVETDEPAVIGDKVAGRHGNKGILSSIIPDHDMPHDKAGAPMEMLLGPQGVPSRMNTGQLLETAASKIARKTGKPYIVENFVPGVDYSQKVLDDLKAHGLSDTEELFDAKTGRSLGQVLEGDQYFLKLHHQADKAMSARSYGGAYGSEGMPPSGSGIPGGGQKIDELTRYALLAHGASANIREFQTQKSDQDQHTVWTSIQAGQPLPDPKPNRSMGHLVGFMRAMGIHMEKKGDKYVLEPLTDKEVLKYSNGEITAPMKTIAARGLRTIDEKGGLFDPKLTGGRDGKFWTSFKLAQRVPNPVFERPIQLLLGMGGKEFEHLVGPDAHEGGKSGFDTIVAKLKAIDVDKDLKASEASLPKLKGAALSKMYRKVRYLRALKVLDLSPVEAYTTQHIPVLPPALRPVVYNIDGTQTVADINDLYRAVGQLNHQIKIADPGTPQSTLQKSRAALYDSVRALRLKGMDLGEGGKKRHRMGLMERMSGEPQPKNSFYQSQVLTRRQDLSARAVITPMPELGLDEIGMPLPIAMEIYKPFVVRELHLAHGYTPLAAQKLLKEKAPIAIEALHRVVAKHPGIFKRDPVLHKYSVQGFTPRIVPGKTFGIHPLVTGGFNADFDGDKMGFFVPISKEAIDEVKNMMPSKNLFSPTTGKIMPVPSQDSLLGLYKATEWGEKKGVVVASFDEARKLLDAHKLKPSDVVTFNGKATTAGRMLLASELPTELQNNEKLLHDPAFRLNKGKLTDFLSDVGRGHPQEYAKIVDAWKDHGNRLAYVSGSSFSLKDFHDGKDLRERILKPFKAEEAKVRASSLSQTEKESKVVDIYHRAIAELEKEGKAHYGKGGNRLYEWVASGARGGWDQFRQMVFGPILVEDAKNQAVPIPILHSYGEGLPTAEYWASLHGARKGAIDKSSKTAEPGALTKVIINTVLDHTISSDDCHTTRGVSLPLTDNDIAGRYLAQPLNPKSGVVPAGTLLTAPLITKLKSEKVERAVVRSPLYCEMPRGVCARCFGLTANGKPYSVGANVGVIAGQALGEPTTQLTLRTFHTGGVVQAQKSFDVGGFKRVEQIFKMPKTLPGAATIAEVGGAITKVVKNTALGGHDVHVGDKKHYVPADHPLLPHIVSGTEVHAGEPLSVGPINPHHLLKHTGNVHAVQGYLMDEILGPEDGSRPGLYPKGTLRRNAEVVIRALTNVTHIDHAPGHPRFLRGQLAPRAVVEHENRVAKEKGLPPIEHTPQLKAMEVVPLAISEDWMGRANFRRLRNTFEEGAAQAWSSDIHESPVAGIAHGAEFGLKKPPAVVHALAGK